MKKNRVSKQTLFIIITTFLIYALIDLLLIRGYIKNLIEFYHFFWIKKAEYQSVLTSHWIFPYIHGIFGRLALICIIYSFVFTVTECVLCNGFY